MTRGSLLSSQCLSLYLHLMFTYSFASTGHLRPSIEGMTGANIHDDEFPDLEALLSEACLHNVVHTEKDGATYANIQNTSPLPRGVEAPALFNKMRAFETPSANSDLKGHPSSTGGPARFRSIHGKGESHEDHAPDGCHWTGHCAGPVRGSGPRAFDPHLGGF